MTGDTIVRSFGYGVYLAEVPEGFGEEEARSAVGSISPVLESWPDPESPRRYTMVTETGFRTSGHEIGVLSEEGVLESATRSADASPTGSLVRVRLRMILLACVSQETDV
jgi:hypothetical protein